MRIGVGKKVGGVYVGGSVSGKSIGKFVLYFFTWPFILAYYILVWPFVKLYQRNKNKKESINLATPQIVAVNGTNIKMSPAEAQSAIQRYKQIADESIKIVTETKNPDTFFERIEKAIEYLTRLAAAYKILGVENNAEQVLAQFISDQEMIINQMIDRYTKEMRRKIYSLTTTKAKLNNADTFKKILLEYQNKMTTNNIIYIENQYNELKSLANN